MVVQLTGRSAFPLSFSLQPPTLINPTAERLPFETKQTNMEQTVAEEDSNHPALLLFLETLRKASKDLQKNSNPILCATHYSPVQNSTIETLLPQAETLLFDQANLSRLSQLLSNLKTFLQSFKESQGYTLKSFLWRQLTGYKIYQVSFAIEAEIQGYIDQELVKRLLSTLGNEGESSEAEKVRVLKDFEKRLYQGFDRDFQELVLKGKVFYILETLLCDPGCAKRIRERAAVDVLALVKFNKDVFVGLVLMGPIIQALISMASGCSVRVLCSLIRLIRTPLIDEIESVGEIPRIVSLLGSGDLYVRVGGVECVCEIAYIGRKEVVKALLELGVVEKLVELQRSSIIESDHCNGAVEGDGVIDLEVEMESGEEKLDGNSPFSGCVSRFAVQVEVGEGLSGKEKKQFKQEILRRVREASVSEAEAASIVAEVLWGSSP